MKLDNLQDIIAYDTPEKDLIVENIEEEYESGKIIPQEILNSTFKFLRKATTEELEKILVFYEKAKARLIKRLNTYLKKYGLEKLHVWTYLVD